MLTQIEAAKKGEITPQIRITAEAEGLPTEQICRGIADGTVVIPANPLHLNLVPCGIGKGLRTKINANIGTSTVECNPANEILKMKTALAYGADAIMDLSTAGDLTALRRQIIATSTAPIGTVPIYEVALRSITRYGSIVEMKAEDIFTVIEEQARDGVDFMTVHCGITINSIERLKKQRRVTDIVSRGGSFLSRMDFT